ncbi:MAG: serine hydrolase [Phototrophicaceae bacterium]
MSLRHVTLTLIALTLLGTVFHLSALAQSLGGATAEAIIEANLRATTDVNSELLGKIVAGTRYPILAKSEFYPWYLLADPTSQQPLGWVFAELVTVTGDSSALSFSTLVVNQNTLPTATTLSPSATNPTSAISISTPTATATFVATTPSGIYGVLSGEVNVRYGPGADFPRIGVAQAGDSFRITGYHTQFPWVQIAFDAVTGGYGWIAIDLIEIQGNLYDTPAINQTNFDLPTLTPTPNAIQPISHLPSLDGSTLSPELARLGDTLWQKLLDQGFDPQTSRVGSLFLMDLNTGEGFTFGKDYAYSGMSLSKINILTTIFKTWDRLPTLEEARELANMMICSENTSSNRILSWIGGTPYGGVNELTALLQQLGLQRTFMVAPFLIDPNITPQPVTAPITTANQVQTNPDPFNQLTVDELGWMLQSIYQCAKDGSGALIDTFGMAYNQRECQQMLYLMSGNSIGALLENGVPESIQVAHKHGWINDTHGDAGVVFTPGGDYILVVVLHNPTWLNFEESFPLIEDISLTVYNHFNPTTPMSAIRDSVVPEQCNLDNPEGLQLIDNLARGRSNN